ncbi:5'-methylthioadenosine/S-adenosylhomocysteine nucleosidase [Vibrio breoganii]|uniref:5'-methylthioadenosine/S-adenosylhomocysteine nucleosidase n=1 Tax=Vibrio breoganii TaxID=553239 RepID=A0ABX1UGE6_9VIBR|nr:5'-methylthioadenosine/S-adenosylhomocysteine nucleosidase [Vibrio breoganii]NMO75283.1 5'-methylthioadenosine/S-adenosylhomocysteine nucleosidase [Vibrio breoganii]NMR71820.1 5'-methylthioadenosine/S-adenosylhomocysteine nucleosidase [Vibrio breoganii]TKF87987.1 5'-methylthioadenosine/S-adenosylhomocysteine nucleosidase [Vibrio breoganii]TKG24276.1 5'-methylthioadenosine/S-adenosylhomocysteine nucleosidase [Vibrio breoganii]
MATLTIIPVANASEMKSVSVESHAAPMQPIMIQGPMPIEAEYFASLLTDVRMEQAGNAKFYIGNLNGYPIVVAQTSKGLENTAAATAVGIERYSPRAIISQGTSGGHDPSLQVGDIVLGKRSVNSNNFKTPKLAAGEGSDSMNWIPMDIMASEESAGEGDAAVDAEKIRYYMGSGNFWNNEIDRMTWLHTNFGTSVEEMETSSAAMIADAYGIPFLGVRVLSNNLTNNGKYDPSTAADCQKFVKEIILHYISTL